MALASADRGAENLLLNCARVQPGERLLLATEPAEFGFFEAAVAARVAHVARQHGILVETLDVGFEPTNPTLPDDLLQRMAGADVVIFLARLGDQLRFSEMPARTRFVVCFAHRVALFAAPDRKIGVRLPWDDAGTDRNRKIHALHARAIAP